MLAQRAEQSGKLRDSTVVLDGYTGFTPIQIQVLEKLLKLCRQVYIPLTVGRGEDPYRLGSPYGLFYLTRQTVHKLCKLGRGDENSPGARPGSRERERQYRGRFRGERGAGSSGEKYFPEEGQSPTEAGKRRYLSGRL